MTPTGVMELDHDDSPEYEPDSVAGSIIEELAPEIGGRIALDLSTTPAPEVRRIMAERVIRPLGLVQVGGYWHQPHEGRLVPLDRGQLRRLVAGRVFCYHSAPFAE